MHRWQENKLRDNNNESGRMGKAGKLVSGKKTTNWWKEQLLSDKRSYFQNQNHTLRTA